MERARWSPMLRVTAYSFLQKARINFRCIENCYLTFPGNIICRIEKNWWTLIANRFFINSFHQQFRIQWWKAITQDKSWGSWASWGFRLVVVNGGQEQQLGRFNVEVQLPAYTYPQAFFHPWVSQLVSSQSCKDFHLRFLSCNQGGHRGQFWPRSTVLFIQHWSELDLHHGEEGASEPLSWIAICGHTIKFGFDHHKSWGCRGGGVYTCCQIVSNLVIVQHSDLPSKLQTLQVRKSWPLAIIAK